MDKQHLHSSSLRIPINQPKSSATLESIGVTLLALNEKAHSQYSIFGKIVGASCSRSESIALDVASNSLG